MSVGKLPYRVLVLGEPVLFEWTPETDHPESYGSHDAQLFNGRVDMCIETEGETFSASFVYASDWDIEGGCDASTPQLAVDAALEELRRQLRAHVATLNDDLRAMGDQTVREADAVMLERTAAWMEWQPSVMMREGTVMLLREHAAELRAGNDPHAYRIGPRGETP